MLTTRLPSHPGGKRLIFGCGGGELEDNIQRLRVVSDRGESGLEFSDQPAGRSVTKTAGRCARPHAQLMLTSVGAE